MLVTIARGFVVRTIVLALHMITNTIEFIKGFHGNYYFCEWTFIRKNMESNTTNYKSKQSIHSNNNY